MTDEEVCVDVALDVMCSRGWIDPEFIDDLVGQLHELYRTGPEIVRIPIRFKKRKPQLELGEDRYSVLMWNIGAARPGEALAHLWEYEQQLDWQRQQPVFECSYCGGVVGAEETYWTIRGEPRLRFYVLDDTGAFAEQTKTCGCGRDLLRMLDRGPQLVIFEYEQLESVREVPGGGSAGGLVRSPDHPA